MNQFQNGFLTSLDDLAPTPIVTKARLRGNTFAHLLLLPFFFSQSDRQVTSAMLGWPAGSRSGGMARRCGATVPTTIGMDVPRNPCG